MDVRVEVLEPRVRRIELRGADRAGAVNDLALEIRRVHHVEVHQPERPDTGGREIERRGRSEASGSDQCHPGSLQAPLARWPDFGQDQVTRIAEHLLV
jgi:hypothetical protein